MSYDPSNLPRTDGLELALLSEAENAEDYRDLWGQILDDEVFQKLEAKLTGGTGDLDVASLSTEVLGNARRQVNHDLTATELNEIIDTVSTDEGGDGGTVDVDPSVTVTSEGETVWLKSDVLVDFNWATVTAADGLDDAYPDSGLICTKFDTKTTNAHVRNVEIDGNESNNTGWTERRRRGGLRIAYNGHDGTDFTPGERPERCSAENIHAHDTIASCVFIGADDCTARNLWVENSEDDHWLYLNSPRRCYVKNVWASGHARQEGITWSDTRDAVETTLENVTISDVSHTVQNSDLEYLIHVRRSGFNGGSGDKRDNVLRDVTIDVGDPSAISLLRFGHPIRVENLTWRGQTNTDGRAIIETDSEAEGAEFVDTTIELDATNYDAVFPAIRVGASKVRFDGLEIVQNASQSIRGVMFQRNEGSAIERVQVAGHDIDVGSAAFRVNGSNDPVRRLSIADGYAYGDFPETFDVSGTVTFEDGTTVPQDVTQINNPYAGYTAYNDGTVGSEGSVEYRSDGSWYHVASNTAI